jgi:hypothetical protein
MEAGSRDPQVPSSDAPAVTSAFCRAVRGVVAGAWVVVGV